jgi:hypothetical protein
MPVVNLNTRKGKYPRNAAGKAALWKDIKWWDSMNYILGAGDDDSTYGKLTSGHAYSLIGAYEV